MLIPLVWIFSLWVCTLEAVELIVLIDHRHLDPHLEQAARYRSWLRARHAVDKGQGTFGHAWIWIYGEDRWGNYWDLELGHTGERDRRQPFYLEALIESAQRAAAGSPEEPLEELERARNDGQLEKGSGGHLPQVALGMELSDQQFDALLLYLARGVYKPSRYCLSDHNCCHFVLACLQQVGVSVEVKPSWHWPQWMVVSGRRLCFFHQSDRSLSRILTPWELAQALEQQLGVKSSLAHYYATRYRCSRWPWVRLWQRRHQLKRVLLLAPLQWQRRSLVWQQ